MAALAASNFSPSFCEVSSPCLRLPFIISESLRSATSSDGSNTQGIVSILVSEADLAKLDLSKLQLFSMDGVAAEPAASMASSEQQSELKTFFDDDFTFQTPFILSPVADLSPGSLAFPVLKSKGVVEAERTNAEHHSVKLGAVSPSPRARKKAVSMDEISLNENLSSLEDFVSENEAEKSYSERHSTNRVTVRRQLPEWELAPLPHPGLGQWAPPLPHPGLEERAETLKKKHFERVLNRTLSEVRSEAGATIDVAASPAARFLLQVMPWELTPPVTPTTTAAAAVPFIWEDVPGRPKRRARPSPCPSLPLPPRLVPAPTLPSLSTASHDALAGSFSSDPSKLGNGDLLSNSVEAIDKPAPQGRRHRKNVHSWHVLHNLFAGSNQRCPLQSEDPVIVDSTTDKGSDNSSVLRPEDVSFAARAETSTDGMSAMSTCIINSTSADLSPANIATLSNQPEAKFSSCETSLSARYELPPLYVAPVSPLTQPYEGLGPLDDNCSKQTKRLHHFAKWFSNIEGGQYRKGVSRARLFFNRCTKHAKVSSDGRSCILNDAKGGQISSCKASHGVDVDEQAHAVHTEAAPTIQKLQNVASQLPPIAGSLHRSPNRGTQRNGSAFRGTKLFIKLRRRGARVIVASYRAIKRALFLRRAQHSKCANLSYYALNR